MIRLPNFHRLSHLKNQIISRIVDHKTLIIVLGISVISFVAFGIFTIKLRSYLLSKIEAARQTAQRSASNDMSYATTAGGLSSNLKSLSASDTAVLGMSNDSNSMDVGYGDTFPTPTPYPIITFTPMPIVTPQPITTTYTSSVPSCVGTPTVDNSQVYVSPSTTQVNTAATIAVELSDCNKTISPVSDTLTIALISGDSGTKINGSSAPVTIETHNGKVSFSVTSSNATTATFLITDTTRSFPVTTPGYHNPSVTFTNGSTGSSGNANCTTSAGAPNAWYSDVYPNPPITTTTGSVTLQVVIRDCFKNTTSVGDSLTISLASGDSGTQVNGNNLPYTLSAQNGQASFNVTSQVTGTVTLVVTDTTSSFTVTDPNNHNPSITFSGSSASTPTPTPIQGDTPTPTPASTDTPTPASTDTPAPSPTSSDTPSPSPTP